MPNTPIMDRLVRKTVERHLPWNVHIDLTYRCNERCVHCYLDHHDYGEMTTREVKCTRPARRSGSAVLDVQRR